jgi:hypothetical protein
LSGLLKSLQNDHQYNVTSILFLFHNPFEASWSCKLKPFSFCSVDTLVYITAVFLRFSFKSHHILSLLFCMQPLINLIWPSNSQHHYFLSYFYTFFQLITFLHFTLIFDVFCKLVFAKGGVFSINLIFFWRIDTYNFFPFSVLISMFW